MGKQKSGEAVNEEETDRHKNWKLKVKPVLMKRKGRKTTVKKKLLKKTALSNKPKTIKISVKKKTKDKVVKVSHDEKMEDESSDAKNIKKTALSNEKKALKISLKKKTKDKVVKVSHDKNMVEKSCNAINSNEENMEEKSNDAKNNHEENMEDNSNDAKNSNEENKLRICEEYPFPCPLCDKRCKSKTGCTQHILHIHKNYCSQCDSTLSPGENIIDHLLIHNICFTVLEDSKVFKCEICKKKYKRFQSFQVHICPPLVKQTPDSESFMHECDVCQKILKTAETLKHHKNTVHRDESEKRNCCEYCGKAFWYRSDLKIHIRTHTGDRPYLCHVCSRRFRHRGHLISHQKTIHEETNYLCEVCGENFKSKKRYRTHGYRTGHLQNAKKPSDIGSFPCEECGKIFPRKADRKVHMRIHTGAKPFTCEDCGKSFRCSNHLKQHKVIHTGEKPFICKYCGKGFSQLANVNCHMKKCKYSHDKSINTIFRNAETEDAASQQGMNTVSINEQTDDIASQQSMNTVSPNELEDNARQNGTEELTKLTFSPKEGLKEIANEVEKKEEIIIKCLPNGQEVREETITADKCQQSEDIVIPEETIEKYIQTLNQNSECGKEEEKSEVVILYMGEEYKPTTIVSQDNGTVPQTVAIDTEQNFLQGSNIDKSVFVDNVFAGQGVQMSIEGEGQFKDKVTTEGLIEGHLETQFFDNVQSTSVIIPIVDVVKLEGKGGRSMEGEGQVPSVTLHTAGYTNSSQTVQIPLSDLQFTCISSESGC